jgi:RHS repeat-associated protein
LNLITTYQVDALGRTTKMTDPDGNSTIYAYDDANLAVRTYTGRTVSGTATSTGSTTTLLDTNLPATVNDYYVGYTLTITAGTDSGHAATVTAYNASTHTLTFTSAFPSATTSSSVYVLWQQTGPTQISRTYLPAANSGGFVYTESMTSSATANLTGGLPDGTETLSSSNIQSLQRDFTNAAGQVLWSDSYATLSGVTFSEGVTASSGVPVDLGTSGTNFYRTTFAYDDDGRQNKVIEPTGTIDRMVYDGFGNLLSTWVGTDDTPTSGYWSPTNLSGTNMLDVQDNYYDTQAAPAVPTLSSITLSGGSAATYYVRISYVINGIESGASVETSISVASGHGLQIAAPSVVPGESAYKVYVSTSLGAEKLQSAPSSVTSNWTQTGSISTSGTPTFTDVGNVNVTIQHPGGSQPDRIAVTAFDWQGNQVLSEGGLVTGSNSTPRAITFDHYDNQGELTEADQYDGTSDTLAAVGFTSGVPNTPTSALLAKSTASYDDQGRVYQTNTYSVSSGAATSGLIGNTFYDHNGNLLAVYNTGQPTLKYKYDGANRVTAAYTTDGGAVNNSGTPLTAWSDAGSVANDVVVTETDSTYDPDGNATLTVTKDRLSTDSNSATGALGGPSTSPDSSNSYVTDYYDAAGRLGAEVNYGTTSESAPGAYDAVPARSDSALVTSNTFDAAGNQDTVTDPRGIVTKSYFDMLGRTTETIAAFTNGTPTSSTNQKTDYTYDGNDDVLTMTAVMPSGTNSQTTAYIYGVGTTAGTDLFSNDLIAKVEYPNPSTGAASTSAANDVSYSYDNLGETTTKTDQNGSTHTYSFDSVGRMTLDAVTTLGSGVDNAVLALGYTFTALSLPYQQTSYSDVYGTTVVNQVQDAYNGFQQLTTEYQEKSGAVSTSTSLKVQYAYSSIATGSLLNEMIYPNGRILHYGYDNSTLDTAIGRIDYLADDNGSGSASTPHLVDYTYQGLSTILGQTYGNGVVLTDTLDAFGNIADLNYVKSGTSTDHFQYGYDRDGNVLYKNNLLSSSFSELYHANSSTSGDDNTAYDPLGRLTAFSRETLSASANNSGVLDTVTTLNSTTGLTADSQSWSLDAIGNQTAVTTDGATTNNTQNGQNELTGFGSNSLTFDNNGNTIADENGNTLTYDAWNRLATDSASTTSYSYDADGRRITETHSTTTTNLYFTTQGQVIEERVSGTVAAQNVFGIDYVNALLLRDDNSTSGNLGISGSGLGTRLYSQHDANWNQTALVSNSGTVLERFVETPYGVQTVLTSAWVVTTDVYHVPNGFQDGRVDPATGLIHLGTPGRDYDPVTGTWKQTDSSGYVNGANTYQYALSNPDVNVDPSGNSVVVYVGWKVAQIAGDVAIEAIGLGPEDPVADAIAAAWSIYTQQKARQALAAPSEPEPAPISAAQADDVVANSHGGNCLYTPRSKFPGLSLEGEDAEWLRRYKARQAADIAAAGLAVNSTASRPPTPSSGGSGGASCPAPTSAGTRAGDLPAKGAPNSTGVKDYGNGKGQIREYGPDGKAVRDFDFGHNHPPSYPGDPHAHDWDWTRPQPRGPGRPLAPGE